LVPPKLTASIPAFHVISAGVHPSAAQALAKRAPSRCGRPASRAMPVRVAISLEL
jgi:hypothetical protein